MRSPIVCRAPSRPPASPLLGRAGALARRPPEADFPLNITVGPFRLAVLHAPREAMRVQRRLMEFELSQGIAWLHESLAGERLAQHFFKLVVRLIHASAGCQTGCIEEAFTQSLAAGLVAFAQHNPDVWVWFNRLLGESVRPGTAFERAAAGNRHRSYHLPRTVLAGGHLVRLQPLPHASAVRHQVDGYFTETTIDRTVRLYECLHGPQRAVVFIHEVTHAIHSAAGLRDRDTRDRFVAAQVAGWLQFVKHNPSAWMWLVATIREQARFEPLTLLS